MEPNATNIRMMRAERIGPAELESIDQGMHQEVDFRPVANRLAMFLLAENSYCSMVETMLREVVDAQYGTSFHHIGDGDGLDFETANAIRAFLEK